MLYPLSYEGTQVMLPRRDRLSRRARAAAPVTERPIHVCPQSDGAGGPWAARPAKHALRMRRTATCRRRS